jgi:cyclin-dependent kinase
LGTPDEEVWPGVKSLPDYKSTFPQWHATDLSSAVKGLDENGLELLALMLIYDPAHRISGETSSVVQLDILADAHSAKRALLHPYFATPAV